MQKTGNINALYRPLQPSVSTFSDEVCYKEFYPDNRLRGFIYSYWRLKTRRPLDNDFSYKVVTDGCVDLLFELHAPEINFLSGLATSYVDFHLSKSFDYIGIRFLPTAFPLLFGIPADLLTNRFEETLSVVPRLSRFLRNEFVPNSDEATIANQLDRYFLLELARTKIDFDARVFKAIEQILRDNGSTHLETLDTGLSERQLRRLFKHYIGESPKMFCKIVRFQRILEAKPTSQSLKHHKLFYDLGYYDQAHFIKDFKHLYGATPAKALNK